MKVNNPVITPKWLEDWIMDENCEFEYGSYRNIIGKYGYGNYYGLTYFLKSLSLSKLHKLYLELKRVEVILD